MVALAGVLRAGLVASVDLVAQEGAVVSGLLVLRMGLGSKPTHGRTKRGRDRAGQARDASIFLPFTRPGLPPGTRSRSRARRGRLLGSSRMRLRGSSGRAYTGSEAR